MITVTILRRSRVSVANQNAVPLRQVGMAAQDDAELLALTAGGDRSAFEAFYRRQRGRTGDLVMEWEFSPSGPCTEPRGDSIEVWVWRFTPVPVKILTVAGWLLGAASGWLLARTVLRLAHRRAVIGLAAVAGVLALSTAATVIFTTQNLLDLPMRNGQPTAIWTAYFPFLMPFGFQFG
ncbi:hypothetical protein [Micromonospora sp. WMMD1219]|uniref:hypothetical protein n=1 Tax=Micromonospora sp. WMMD1219 TaxID=3404115 RepID=UPI003BF58EE6